MTSLRLSGPDVDERIYVIENIQMMAFIEAKCSKCGPCGMSNPWVS